MCCLRIAGTAKGEGLSRIYHGWDLFSKAPDGAQKQDNWLNTDLKGPLKYLLMPLLGKN